MLINGLPLPEVNINAIECFKLLQAHLDHFIDDFDGLFNLGAVVFNLAAHVADSSDDGGAEVSAFILGLVLAIQQYVSEGPAQIELPSNAVVHILTRF